MNPLTERQLAVLAQVAAGNHTCRGIALALGMRSNHGAYDHLTVLRRKGCVTWRRARTGIELTDVGLRALGVCCPDMRFWRELAAKDGPADGLVLFGRAVKFCPYCGRRQPR